MIFAKDISDRVNADFLSESEYAFRLMDEAIRKYEYLSDNRIIRCIVFLANKEMVLLEKYIEVARLDPRDVMCMAEYEFEKGMLKRVRDFSNPFEGKE